MHTTVLQWHIEKAQAIRGTFPRQEEAARDGFSKRGLRH